MEDIFKDASYSYVLLVRQNRAILVRDFPAEWIDDITKAIAGLDATGMNGPLVLRAADETCSLGLVSLSARHRDAFGRSVGVATLISDVRLLELVPIVAYQGGRQINFSSLRFERQ